MLRAAVIYHMWPHYRQAVAIEMDRSDKIDYTFYGSGEAFEGIVHADPGLFRRFVRSPFSYRGRLMWQPQAIKAACAGGYDAIIYLANPNFVSTWLGAAIARRRGVAVLFWAHGWLREDRGIRQTLRNLFFRRADQLLVYAERAKRLGIRSGFPAEKITVVYNSLDVARADAVVARIEDGSLTGQRPQDLFAAPDRPLVICTARITSLCRYELLLEASRLLTERGVPINVLLVGDGPDRAKLEAMAAKLGVATHFFGACYDEEVLGQLIYRADLTVSPGKIGLTAMHSLMYGTPAVTHDNLDEQMPEVEALTEGVTGALFRQGDAASLADRIAGWIAECRPREAVRAACRAQVHDCWNPEVQAEILERTVLKTVADAQARR